MDNGKELLEYMDQTRDYQMRSIYTDLELLQIQHDRVALCVMKIETYLRRCKVESEAFGQMLNPDYEEALAHADNALMRLKLADGIWRDVSAKTLIHLGDEEAVEELKTKIEDCNK